MAEKSTVSCIELAVDHRPLPNSHMGMYLKARILVFLALETWNSTYLS